MNTLARELRKRRMERGYTQTELAKLLGVSRRMVIYYEHDVWPPHDVLLKLNLLFQYDFSIHIYGNTITRRRRVINKR